MEDTPNPADFSVDEKPGEYRVIFKISGSMELTIKADDEAHASKLAEEFADRIAEGYEDFDFDDVDDVDVAHLRKSPPMYRVTQDGSKMQVSRLRPGDVPREPDERGF